jgi:DNA-binding beta-propeller fold protein YncE
VASRPTGVVFAFGQLFVGTGTGSVEVLDPYGQRLYFLGGKQGAFGRVADLAVDEGAGLLYILDSLNKSIIVYQANGSPAGYEIGNGILQQPAGLTIDPSTGDLIVSDFGSPGGSASVRVFDSAGNQLTTIGGTTGGGMFGGTRFSTPQGLYADGMGNLYLIDARSGEVQAYEIATGTQLYTLGSLGSGFEELFYPLDVYVDPLNRDVYVTDQGNDRIMVFQEGGVIQ